MSEEMMSHSQQYQMIAQAIRYITSQARHQPSLKDISEHVSLSEYHLQRVFTDWAGVSPKRFLQFVTKEYALDALKQSQDVLSVALDSGLSGAGRLHDLMVTCEAMSPGEIKTHGKGLIIEYGSCMTPFGQAFIGWTARGICHLEFCDEDYDSKIGTFSLLWKNADLTLNNERAGELSRKIFCTESKSRKLHLLIRGSNFQLKVWEALIKTSSSQILSYSQLAQLAGSPKAQRAVGSALAANSIGFLIPCHRVIRESGDAGIFRWGHERKLAIQAWEAGVAETGSR